MAIRPEAVRFDPVGAEALPVLGAFYIQLCAAHGHPITPAAAEAKLAKGLAAGQKAMLMRLGERVIGTVTWADLGDHVFIRNFVIDEAHRGRGLGGALFARLRREVFAHGIEIRLEASGDHALAFWRAQGLGAWSTGMRIASSEETL